MRAYAGEDAMRAAFPIDRPEAAGCDLCGATGARVVAPASPENCRIVACTGCGLLYASPGLGDAEMDAFYEEAFAIDPGSAVRAGSGLPDERKVRKERRQGTDWALDAIGRFLDVRDKTILDLRCRTGSLSAALARRGADVYCVEPFEANAEYARRVRGLPRVQVLPFSRIHRWSDAWPARFDVVNALAQHVLAHVPSPRRLLAAIRSALEPGGTLFLDEKDVLHPALHKTATVFDSGVAHQYHLTERTTAGYLRAAGFEVLECGIERRRVSDYHHVLAVARRPEHDDAPGGHGLEPPVDGELERRLRWLARTWRWRLAKHVLQRRARRWLA